MKKRQVSGFTLIELMVVIIIIGILAGIAIPSYLESVRRTNRVEAKTDMMDIAQQLQRCYTALGTFLPPAIGQCSAYDRVNASGGVVSTGQNYYRITISNVTALTYTLTATAIKAPQTKDVGCLGMTLNQAGAKAPDICWQR